MFNLLGKQKLDVIGQYKQDLIIYRHIHKKMGEVIEAVFGGYSKDKYIFYPPDDKLNIHFNELRETVLLLGHKPEFEKLKITIFRQFQLYKNYKDMIEWWEIIKEGFYEDDRMLTEKANFDYELPPDLQVKLTTIDKLVKEHLEKKNAVLKANHIYPAKDQLNFGARKSITKTIFEMLSEASGEFVRVLTIAQKVKKNESYVRIVINQLKKKIEKSKANMIIEANRKGSYRLIVS